MKLQIINEMNRRQQEASKSHSDSSEHNELWSPVYYFVY